MKTSRKGSVTWDPLTLPTDYAIVGGKKTPGICEINGAESIRKWDEQRGYGQNGATLLYTGEGLARFSMRLKLYTRQDWLDWHAFRPHIVTVPSLHKGALSLRPDALDIWHPLLSEIGIVSVVLESESQPMLTDDSGEWTIELKFIQFREPKGPALAKAVASKATPGPTPHQKEIIRLKDILVEVSK